jgi:hypothetical protein
MLINHHIKTAVQMFLHYHAGLIFILSIRKGKTRAFAKSCGRVPRCLASAKKEQNKKQREKAEKKIG